jgi:hypothetical protein
VIRLPTPSGGEIQLTRVGAGQCARCRASVDAGARLICTVRPDPYPGERLDVPLLCGGCVSAAFAYLFGVGHLAAGGAASELRPALTPAGVCPHCGRDDAIERDSDSERRRCGHCRAAWNGERTPPAEIHPLDPRVP